MFVNFSPKFLDMICKLAAQKLLAKQMRKRKFFLLCPRKCFVEVVALHENCWRFTQNFKTKICIKLSFPWSCNLALIPLIQILGGGPQDLKNWNGYWGEAPMIWKIEMLEENRRTYIKQSHKETFLLKQRIIVKATLWWTFCPFTKCDLLLSLF